MESIANIYCDGGVCGSNPSLIGGTWAWVGTDVNDIPIIEMYGFVPTPIGGSISSNVTEEIAIVKALEFMPDGWSGKVMSDSEIALGRVFSNWKTKGLPRNVILRRKAAVDRLGEIKPVLLKGHPTKADIARGYYSKEVKVHTTTGPVQEVKTRPISIHNVRCDDLCNEAKIKAKESGNRLIEWTNIVW